MFLSAKADIYFYSERIFSVISTTDNGAFMSEILIFFELIGNFLIFNEILICYLNPLSCCAAKIYNFLQLCTHF